MRKCQRVLRGDRGFTLIEMSIALVLFAVIGLAVYGVLIRTSHSQNQSSTMTVAQQNARMALDTILGDLREAGYGISPATQVPIETASQYRVTFVVDRDEDGVTDPGERVTYFVDTDQTDASVASTPNPADFVIRRVISDAGDVNAAPGAAKGQIVAYGVTQRTPANNGWNVPLFAYFNSAGAPLMGTGNDPAGAAYGKTVADSALGKGTGSGWNSLVRTVQVQVVTEASYQDARTGRFRQVRMTGRIHPRNVGAAGRAFFTANTGGIDTGADTTGGGGGGGDTTVVPPGPPVIQLPPVEPAIHIATEQVLSLIVQDLHELDSHEGSQVTTDHRHDWDIVIGTQAAGTNNVAVWFEGYPDKYVGPRYYNSVPNYRGSSSRSINHLATGELDGNTHGDLYGRPLQGSVNEDQYADAVAAVGVGTTTGGFEVWLNQGTAGLPGHVGTGTVTTTATRFHTNSSGRGLAIALADFDRDGDLDVVLGTKTAANAGKLEFWSNNGLGVFTQQRVVTAAGEVNAVAVADFDHDGAPDVAAGTKTANSGSAGKLEVWLNRTATPTAYDFARQGPWTSHGQVKTLAAGAMNDGESVDLVTGVQTNTHRGEVELWLNNGSGTMTLGDYASADDVVLSVAVGQIDYDNQSLDIVAGNAARSVQSWFCNPQAATAAEIIPTSASWSDANAGGAVNAVRIVKLEASRDNPGHDLLNDIVCGTAVNSTSGSIVIYLNPYVWTLNP